jgi:biopolymer transport protein ExbD
MQLKSSLPAVGGALHVAPLLATALIFIIYSLLSTSLVAPSGVMVQLPQSVSVMSGFEQAQVITLAVGHEQPLYFNGKRISQAELPELLKNQPKDKHKAILYADRQASYGRVTDVSGLILAAGYQLAHATTPPKSEAAH